MKTMNPEKASVIRVLLVDDHEMVRTGLKMILSAQAGIEVVGEASSVSSALVKIPALEADVILLDMRLKDGTGLDIYRKLDRSKIKSKFLVLTSFSNDDVLVEAVEAGMDGFILKDVDAPSLVSAIRKVAAGESALDTVSTRMLMDRIRKKERKETASFHLLSAQELKVLEQVALGKTNKEIGMLIGLSDKTVKNYLANLMSKLMISRRAEAASLYTRWQHDKADD